jgi:peptidoglycan/xylan/chitin deacetylase (PgdA/CDA1 family)
VRQRSSLRICLAGRLLRRAAVTAGRKVRFQDRARSGLPGSIVLAHDGGPQPSATLMQQLDRLVGSMTDAGYTFVTVSELLAARGATIRGRSPW